MKRSRLIALVLSTSGVFASVHAADETNFQPKKAVTLSAGEFDLEEQRIFRGQLPTKQQFKRSLPLKELDEVRVDHADIAFQYKTEKIDGSAQKYADRQLATVLELLHIRLSKDETKPLIKVTGTISNADSEVNLSVYDFVQLKRQPSLLYQTTVFTTTEKDGSAEKLIDLVVSKFGFCWKLAKTNRADKRFFKNQRSEPNNSSYFYPYFPPSLGQSTLGKPILEPEPPLDQSPLIEE